MKTARDEVQKQGSNEVLVSRKASPELRSVLGYDRRPSSEDNTERVANVVNGHKMGI
jgi:hypothetical protein